MRCCVWGKAKDEKKRLLVILEFLYKFRKSQLFFFEPPMYNHYFWAKVYAPLGSEFGNFYSSGDARGYNIKYIQCWMTSRILLVLVIIILVEENESLSFRLGVWKHCMQIKNPEVYCQCRHSYYTSILLLILGWDAASVTRRCCVDRRHQSERTSLTFQTSESNQSNPFVRIGFLGFARSGLSCPTPALANFGQILSEIVSTYLWNKILVLVWPWASPELFQLSNPKKRRKRIKGATMYND